jgi:hypothetical protein
MTRRADVPFPERLALARELVARGPGPATTHLADQYDSAGREARGLHDRIVSLMPLLEPNRPWHQRLDTSPSDDVRAVLLAAVLGCLGQICPHLKRGGPQPAITRLALRRVDCARCVGTVRRPPPEDEDRCDVCGEHGVTVFSPFAVRMGPSLIVGDACPACAETLGICTDREEAS